MRDAHAGPLPRVPDSRHAPVRAGGGAPAGLRAGIRGAVRRAARGRQAFAQAGRAGRAAGRGSPARRACRPCCRGAAGCARHGAPCPSAPRRRALCRRAPGSRVIAAYAEGYDELDRRVLGGLPDLAGHGPGRRQHAAGVEHAQDLPGAPAGRGLADPALARDRPPGVVSAQLLQSVCGTHSARSLRRLPAHGALCSSTPWGSSWALAPPRIMSSRTAAMCVAILQKGRITVELQV